MLNFVYTTEKDRREAASIERRRALEEERKKRIFNAKARISLDYEALDEQIQQKRIQKEEDRMRDLQHDRLALQLSEIGLVLENQEKEERKKLAREINEFRLNFQKPEDRREFDINDPKNYKSIAARLYDDDPRCGISSAQKFEGEDLYSRERAKIQREQLKAWLDQQMDEKEAAEKERIDSENAYKAALMARDQRAVELENMEKECRKRMDKACSQYNQALASEREMKMAEKNKEDEMDCLAHNYNVLMSDMMSETVDVASALGANRKVSTQVKGMTNEERQRVLEEQKMQIEEAKAKKEHEKRFDREWDEYFNGIQKTVAAKDLEIARQQREINRQIMDENKKLETEQKNHQEYLKKIVYSNRPTEAYYDQFNRNAR